jgi:hypothetical protein
VLVAVGVRIVEAHRADDELDVVGPVVPDRAHGRRRDPHGGPRPDVDDLVAELELQRPGRDEVDLLLRLVGMAVAALAARLRRHPPVRERDLLGADRLGEHPHLAGVVAEHVGDVVGGRDRVVAHAATIARAVRSARRACGAGATHVRRNLEPAARRRAVLRRSTSTRG